MNEFESNLQQLEAMIKDQRLCLGLNHSPHGKRGFVIDYLVGENWTEWGTMGHEGAAKVCMAMLLKQGATVRMSKTFECIELGEAITPDQFLAEQRLA